MSLKDEQWWKTCDLYDFVGCAECSMSEEEKWNYRVTHLKPLWEKENMEQQKEETKHYTPQLALKESKEHFNWREYAQTFIDKYVAEAVKESRTKTQVEFYKPDNFDYADTTEHLIKACQELGWEVAKSKRTSFGCIYLDIDWSNADKK